MRAPLFVIASASDAIPWFNVRCHFRIGAEVK